MKVSEILSEGWEAPFGEGPATEQMIEIMNKRGYRLLGHGVEKAAFINSKHEVIVLVSGDKTSRDTAIKWFKYCQRNNNNPHLPTVIDFADFADFTFKSDFGGTEKYLQVKLEKLFELSESKNHMLGYACEETAEFAEFASGSRSKKIAEVKSHIEKRVKDDQKFQYMVSLIDDIDYFIDTLIDVIEYGESNGFTQYLHEGNFMLGSDGNLVITDPWI